MYLVFISSVCCVMDHSIQELPKYFSHMLLRLIGLLYVHCKRNMLNISRSKGILPSDLISSEPGMHQNVSSITDAARSISDYHICLICASLQLSHVFVGVCRLKVSLATVLIMA